MSNIEFGILCFAMGAISGVAIHQLTIGFAVRRYMKKHGAKTN